MKGNRLRKAISAKVFDFVKLGAVMLGLSIPACHPPDPRNNDTDVSERIDNPSSAPVPHHGPRNLKEYQFWKK